MEERRTYFISRGEAKRTLWVAVLQCQALLGKEGKGKKTSSTCPMKEELGCTLLHLPRCDTDTGDTCTSQYLISVVPYHISECNVPASSCVFRWFAMVLFNAKTSPMLFITETSRVTILQALRLKILSQTQLQTGCRRLHEISRNWGMTISSMYSGVYSQSKQWSTWSLPSEANYTFGLGFYALGLLRR